MQFKDATRKSLSCVCFESASDTDVATQKQYGDVYLNFDKGMIHLEKYMSPVREPRYSSQVSLFGSKQLMNVCKSVGP